MQLDFTPDQEELRDNVRTVLASECPMTFVRAVVEEGATTDRLWSQMVDLGWPALTVPESAGGLGLGLLELAVVAEELGRVVAPGPFLATVSQFAPAVREAGTRVQADRWLLEVATSGLTGSLAIAEDRSGFDPAGVETIVEPRGDRVCLRGTKRWVVGAAAAAELVVVGRAPGTAGDEGVTAVVVPTSAVTISPVETFDPSRSVATVALTDVMVERDRVLGIPGPTTATALRRAVEEATVALALETVGTCQTIFDVTLEYAKQREQFGVPIGSFQAIKHKFADMVIALERARATGYFAALAIAEDDDRRSIATSMAKAAAGDAQRLIAKEGIQIHGGIGFTWEHDMHLYVRRVKSNAALFGTAADHRSSIAGALGL